MDVHQYFAHQQRLCGMSQTAWHGGALVAFPLGQRSWRYFEILRYNFGLHLWVYLDFPKNIKLSWVLFCVFIVVNTHLFPLSFFGPLLKLQLYQFNKLCLCVFYSFLSNCLNSMNCLSNHSYLPMLWLYRVITSYSQWFLWEKFVCLQTKPQTSRLFCLSRDNSKHLLLLYLYRLQQQADYLLWIT